MLTRADNSQVLLLSAMTKQVAINLDAVNNRRRPVLGVVYRVLVDGVEVLTARKAKPGNQRLVVTTSGDVVEVEATLDGWAPQRVQMKDSNSWSFKFLGAGVPGVLIVCALPKETAAVLSLFDSFAEDAVPAPREDPNKYWVGDNGLADDGSRRRVLVATSGMGIVSAAVTATHALRSFPQDITQVMMVGIAGGCPNHLKRDDHVRLGDIVAANEKGIIQYDFIKRTVDGDEHRANAQRPSKELMDAAQTLEIRRRSTNEAPWEALIAKAIKKNAIYKRPKASTDLLHDVDVEEKKVLSHPKDPVRRAGQPKLHRGAIGSANILLKDPRQRDAVRDRWGVRAIEMEGSGVLDAGWSMNRDVMVVRGICDYCDSFKNDDWQDYAALVAAAYAHCLIDALPAQTMP